jgi:hypothetical protein
MAIDEFGINRLSFCGQLLSYCILTFVYKGTNPIRVFRKSPASLLVRVPSGSKKKL